MLFAKSFGILFSAAVIHNIALQQYLGLCPLIGASKQLAQALGLAAATAIVMLLATSLTFFIYLQVLLPLHLEDFSLIVDIVLIASLVQMLQQLIQVFLPTLYNGMGIYLTLITSNCAVLGLSLISQHQIHDWNSFWPLMIGHTLGFVMVLMIFAGLQAQMKTRSIPNLLVGTPILLISAGIVSMAFQGFNGWH